MGTRSRRVLWAWVGLLGVGLSGGCREADAPSGVEAHPETDAALPVAELPTPGPDSGRKPEPPAQEPSTPSEPDATPEPEPRPEDPPPPDDVAPASRRPWLRGSYSAGVSPEGLAVGDFDGDGAPDVVVSSVGRNYSSLSMSRRGELLLLTNDGRGGLARPSSRHALVGATGRVVAGDVDGDGRLDALAGTNWGVRVLLGQGTGSLRERQPQTNLCTAAVHSLGLWKDGAGKPRLWAVGVSHDWFWLTDPVLCVARPLGEDRFATWNPVAPQVGLRPGPRATAADFDEDGLPDLLFSGEQPLNEGKARLFWGDASEQLTPGPSFPLMPGFERVYSADVNRDGHVDMLGLKEDTLWVFLGSGLGGFSLASSQPLGVETRELAVVDLDADGVPDVVALHAERAEVSLWRGSATGDLRSWGRMAVGRLPRDAATADLDGDGTPELLVAEADDNTVSVYALPEQPMTELPRPFTCPIAPAEPGPVPLPPVAPVAELGVGGGSVRGVVGDFDVDGREDLAIALAQGGVRLVLHGEGSALPTRELELVRGRVALSLVAGDLDGDGRMDLAGEFREDRSPPAEDLFHTLLLWNEAEAPFTQSQLELRWWFAFELLAGDLNRDGRVDLVLSPLGQHISSTLRLTNLGGRAFRSEYVTNLNPTGDGDDGAGPYGRPRAADFNGDGTLDIVHLTDGINITPTAPDGRALPGGFGLDYPVDAKEGFFTATDVDGDGVPDLVTDAEARGQVLLMRGDGNGAVQAPIVCALPAGERVLAWEDLDGNGTADVASVSEEGRRLWVVPRTKEGRWAAPRTYALDSPALWVRSVDLLGDERPELAVMLASGRLLVFPTP